MSLKNLSVRKKIPKIYKSKILNHKVNKIFKKFGESFKIDTNFIVAVSGGADSLALAFLTKVYALKKNLNPRYFIVDHKLRKESTYEAYKVKKILKSLKINSQVLTWKGKKPTSNIQSFQQLDNLQLLKNLLQIHIAQVLKHLVKFFLLLEMSQ